MLRRQFDRARRPSERDATLEAAEIVEEPRATGQRRLPCAHHLEHAEKTLAIVLDGNAETLEGLVVYGGIRIDQQTDSVAQKRTGVFHERRRETIVGCLGVILHEIHRGAKWRAPFLRSVRLVAASAIRAPSLDPMRTTPRGSRRHLERSGRRMRREVVIAIRDDDV